VLAGASNFFKLRSKNVDFAPILIFQDTRASAEWEEFRGWDFS